MKTIITIENGKIQIQIDDQQAVAIQVPEKPAPATPISSPPPAPLLKSPSGLKTPAKPKTSPPVPGKRTCEICGDDISHLHKLAKTCSKPECKRAKTAAYNAKWAKKKNPGSPPAEPKVEYCKHCAAWTTHDTANHPAVIAPNSRELKPEFLPGHEKSPKEVESWRPQPVTPPVPMVRRDEAAEVEQVMDEQRKNFADPWDCAMCRDAGSLCNMHENLSAEGKKPPVGRGVE